MCGIAGLVGRRGRPVDPDVARRMAATLFHRGPDGEGCEHPAPHVALAHRRLAIIDVDGGRQPLCNEDGRIWITFNGEIFNYRELRRELQAAGHRFRTNSDTEVLVHLYEEHGPACLERLNGQFAFAIWDGEQLFCARDPLGIKPFYFYEDKDRFAFASEPRAFFALPGADLAIDTEAIHLYFRYHYIPSPVTCYRKVRKLRPGESLTVTAAGLVERRRYFDLAAIAMEDLSDEGPGLAGLRDELDAAVERQMVADVPVGAFLSGGVDSSTVVALMQRHAGQPARTFCLGFPEKDERAYAREVADWVGTEHHDDVLDDQHAGLLIPELLARMDEPVSDSSLIPTHAVSRLARQRAKVALSGDGGDELFAGYGRYGRLLDYLTAPGFVRPFWGWAGRRMPRTSDPSRWAGLDTSRFPDWPRQVLAELADARPEAFYGPALLERARDNRSDPVRDEIARCAHLPPVAQVLAIDIGTSLADRMLTKVDRASMWASLEVRVPLLDVDFVRFAMRLAPSLRLYGGRPKQVLRAAFPDALPATVFSRKKKGFGPPVKYWFARGLAGWLEEQLRDSVAVREGLLDGEAVANLFNPRWQRKLRGTTVWRVLALESWVRNVRAGRLGEPGPTPAATPATGTSAAAAR